MRKKKELIYVTVLMPVYNGESFLEDAIKSILNQSYRNFEFVIVNDGSTDKSLAILKKFQKKDKRIIILNQKNLGIVSALNNGILLSRGDYIFRMDADDLSTFDRIETQLEYMISNGLDVCGTWVKCFGRREKILKPYVSDRDIKTAMFFLSPFAHPSVAFKKDIFSLEGYKETYSHAEDYYLWARLAISNKKLGNLPKVCLHYRDHENQISNKKSYLQYASGLKIRRFYYFSIFSPYKKIFFFISPVFFRNNRLFELNIFLYLFFVLKITTKELLHFRRGMQ